MFFKIFKANTEDSITKITNSIQPLIDNQTNQKNIFCNNIETTYSSYNNCVGKSSIIFTKVENDLIIPLTNYKDSLIQIYNENLTKFKGILFSISHSKSLYESSRMRYYQASLQSYMVTKRESSKDIFSGLTTSANKEKEMNSKTKSQEYINEKVYKYELIRHNTVLKEQNEQYYKLIEIIKQLEENRTMFVKSILDKYKDIMIDYNKIIQNYIDEYSQLISNEVCTQDIKKMKDEYDGLLVEDPEVKGKKVKFIQTKFISFDKYAGDKKEKLTLKDLQVDNKDENKTMSQEEADSKIKEVINELVDDKDIEIFKIAEVIEILRSPLFENSMKRFLDCFLELLKNSSKKVGNLNNLEHLSNILSFISLSHDSIFKGKFELNFKIIFISERIFYQNKEHNYKIYLSALVSKNKYFRSKFFWRDILELKLANKLVDHIDRLKKVTLPIEKKPSLLSKIGNHFGKNKEIRNQSLLYNSRIKQLISNYDELDITKIPLVDKIAVTEISTIIRESIPSFANFNFPSEECLDMIAELAEQYKIPKDHINYYVTYYNVSINTIRRALPNEINSEGRRITKYIKIKPEEIIYKIFGYCLQYLNYKDYSCLLLLNKKTYEKINKKIYKIVLKNPNVNTKIRLSIWKNVLKVKDLKKKYNYKELLKATEGNKKLHNEVKNDVLRTFIGDKERTDEIREKMINILKVIASNNGESKYCQGMNYIAEFMFELMDSEEEAFYIFMGFFENTEYPLIFAKDLLKLKVFFYAFKRLISLYEPELYSYFNSNSVDIHYFMPSWFITLFLSSRQNNSSKVPPIVLLRILDSFILSGWKSLMKVGICVLHAYETELMKLKYEELLQFLINDIVKLDFFLDNNLEKVERCFVETKIKKRLIRNIEDEFIQEINLNEKNKSK